MAIAQKRSERPQTWMQRAGHSFRDQKYAAANKKILAPRRLIGFELKWFDGDGYGAIRLLDGEINFL